VSTRADGTSGLYYATSRGWRLLAAAVLGSGAAGGRHRSRLVRPRLRAHLDPGPMGGSRIPNAMSASGSRW
jgi:hypothetical protein